jgi:hypothetical protein
MKTIVFSYSFSACKIPHKYIDLSQNQTTIDKDIDHDRIELSTLFKRFGKEWFDEFSAWLGQLNCTHASLLWWAHTGTAKNVLSSSLGQHYFKVRAIVELAKKDAEEYLYVLGATAGEMASIVSLLPSAHFRFTGLAWHLRHLHKLAHSSKALVKAFLQMGMVVIGFFSYRFSKPAKAPDLCLFTYMDGVRRAGIDNYFGNLPELLHKQDKSISLLYLAYVYRPYRRRLKQLLKEHNETPYIALHAFLQIKDYIWVIYHGLLEWWRNVGLQKNTIKMLMSILPSYVKHLSVKLAAIFIIC